MSVARFRTRRRWLELVVVAALVIGCSDPPVEGPGGFGSPPFAGLRGSSLVDAQGRSLVLRGVNISQDNKHPPYHPEGSPFDSPDGYRELADMGVTVVRYLVEWAAVEPERGAYDDEYLDLVASRVGWAADAGIFVIIDMHQDLYGEVFSNGAPRWACDEALYETYEPVDPWFQNYFSDEVRQCFDGFWASAELRGAFVAAWQRVAARFANEPAVIGYDILNEPWHGSADSVPEWEADTLTGFYEQVGGAIREVAPSQLLFFEPNPLRNTGLRESGVRALSLPGTVYAPHYYGLDYEADGVYDGSLAEIEYNFELLDVEAELLGAGSFLGEFGARTAQADAEAYLKDLVTVANQHRLSWAYWDFSARGGGALLDPDTSLPKEPLWRWAFVPYPTAVPGELIDWQWDADSAELTVEIESDGTEAVVLVAPSLWYPAGPSASLSDGRVEVVGGRVVYYPAGSGRHTISLR
jgi:endoglycosylceramidase